MNILLIGHYGGENFGDEVMLFSLLSNLVKKKDVQITVVSKNRKIPYFQEKNVKFVSPSLNIVSKQLCQSDMVVLGGGTHFHDGYNPQRLRRHYFYLMKILLIYALGSILNFKVYQLGVGYGPFYNRFIEILADLSVQLSSQTLVRDTTSYRWLEKINTTSRKNVSFDLAGLHPIFEGEHGQDDQQEQAKDWIGISLTSLRFNEQTHGDEFWTEVFIPAITNLYETKSLKIKIFVFRGGDKESDLPLSKLLYESLAKEDMQRVQLIDFSEEVTPFIREIRECSQFIATRYHSALLAYLCQCELFIIPYHNKLNALAEDIQLQEEAIYGVLQDSVKLFHRLNDFIADNQQSYKAGLDVKEAVKKSQKNLSVFEKYPG